MRKVTQTSVSIIVAILFVMALISALSQSAHGADKSTVKSVVVGTPPPLVSPASSTKIYVFEEQTYWANGREPASKPARTWAYTGEPKAIYSTTIDDADLVATAKKHDVEPEPARIQYVASPSYYGSGYYDPYGYGGYAPYGSYRSYGLYGGGFAYGGSPGYYGGYYNQPILENSSSIGFSYNRGMYSSGAYGHHRGHHSGRR